MRLKIGLNYFHSSPPPRVTRPYGPAWVNWLCRYLPWHYLALTICLLSTVAYYPGRFILLG